MLVQNMGGNTTHSCFHLDPRSTFHFHLTKAFTQAESPRLNLFFRPSQEPTTNNIQGFTFTRATNHKKFCKQQNSCKQHNNYIVNLASPVWIGLRRQRWEQQSRLFLCSKHSEASVDFISLQLFLAGSKFQTQTHTEAQTQRQGQRQQQHKQPQQHSNTKSHYFAKHGSSNFLRYGAALHGYLAGVQDDICVLDTMVGARLR